MSLRDLVRKTALHLRGPNFTPKPLIDLYLNTAARLSFGTYLRWKYIPPQAPRRLHLGCGPIYLSGWTNIEILPIWRHDLWLDLRFGLPFGDGSISGIYANQVLEHFDLPDLIRLLRECYRVLAPGGVVRFAVPSVERAVAAYQRGDIAWFASQNAAHRSLGAAFHEYLLCQNHHRVLLDFSFFAELLSQAGLWRSLAEPTPGLSALLSPEELRLTESRWDKIQASCLVIEAVKA